MSRKTVSLTFLPVHLYKLENSLKSEQLHTYLFFFIFKIISSCCTNRKDVINSEGLRIILKYKSNNGSLWKSDLLQVVKKFRIRIPNSKNLFVHWKHCYIVMSPKGTCIVNAYCQFSQQACTVRPWEARFLGNKKTPAAQNRAS